MRSGTRALAVADVAAKVALGALLVAAVVAPDLTGLKVSAGTGRLVVYPLGALAVPIWWLIFSRRVVDRRSYPWAADLLVTLPWLLDTVGNRFGLFESVLWWDDMMHVLNWLLLTAGVLLAWAPARRVGGGVVIMVGLGFGVTAALVWELLEYASFMRFSTAGVLALRDTLGDLTLGTLGSIAAGVVVALARRRTRNPVRAAEPDGLRSAT